MPPFAIVPETPSEPSASTLCAAALAAEGAVGSIEDFESPHAAVTSAPVRTSDQVSFKVVIMSPVDRERGAATGRNRANDVPRRNCSLFEISGRFCYRLS